MIGTRVAYPIEVKNKVIELKLSGMTIKEIMTELNIKNKTQVETWWRWYRKGETHRFLQTVGKQYSFNKGPEYASEIERLKVESRFLTQQLDILKKYKEKALP